MVAHAQTEGTKYIVVVKGPLPDDVGASVGDIAKVLHLSEAQTRVLLKRLPGTITRPISQAQATEIANALRLHGLRTLLKIYQPPPRKAYVTRTWPDSLEPLRAASIQDLKRRLERRPGLAHHFSWRSLYRIMASALILLGLIVLAILSQRM